MNEDFEIVRKRARARIEADIAAAHAAFNKQLAEAGLRAELRHLVSFEEGGSGWVMTRAEMSEDAGPMRGTEVERLRARWKNAFRSGGKTWRETQLEAEVGRLKAEIEEFWGQSEDEFETRAWERGKAWREELRRAASEGQEPTDG